MDEELNVKIKLQIFSLVALNFSSKLSLGFFKHVVMEVEQCLKFQGNEYWFHEVFGFVVKGIGKLGVEIVMNHLGVGHS
jgi:hypothetical protein